MINGKPITTREAALKHVETVAAVHGTPITDPKKYFRNKIAELRSKLFRERKLDPAGVEMTKIRSYMSVEEYFSWMSGVLGYQEAYLAALS